MTGTFGYNSQRTQENNSTPSPFGFGNSSNSQKCKTPEELKSEQLSKKQKV